MERHDEVVGGSGRMRRLITERDLVALVREEVNLSAQNKTAERIGVSPQYINDLIRGRREPSQKIASAFGYKRIVVFEELPPEEVLEG